MFIAYNYKCVDTECEACNVIFELLVKREEKDTQHCTGCGSPLERTFSPTHFPVNVSWSTWRV